MKNSNNKDTAQGYHTRLGFKSVREMQRMATLVRIDSQAEALAFKRWKEKDGSRDGLLHLLGIFPSEQLEEYVYRDVEVRDRWFEYLKGERIDEFRRQKMALEQELMDHLRTLEVIRIRSLIK